MGKMLESRVETLMSEILKLEILAPTKARVTIERDREDTLRDCRDTLEITHSLYTKICLSK